MNSRRCRPQPCLRVDPQQRSRILEIRDNLLARIDEARREGWLGEAEGLNVSLAAARWGTGSRAWHHGWPRCCGRPVCRRG